MTTANQEQDIKEALNRICSHKRFAHSSTYSGLLEYLVIKTLNKEEINEVIIGSDLYGIDYSENKSNSTVRTYMHKLRKKLAEYYSESEEKEPVIFVIMKGQYNMSFLTPQEYYKTQQKEIETISIPVKCCKVAGAFVLLSILAFLGIKQYANRPSVIWENFFKPNEQNLLVLSDQFIVYERFSNWQYYPVIYQEINSNEDFIKFTQKHPEKKIRTTDYTMTSKMAPYSVKPLSLWFEAYGSDFNLELESLIKYEEIPSNNIVFVGQYKTMNFSKTLFLKDSQVFTAQNDGFRYKTDSIDHLYKTQYGGNSKVEYAMVSYTSLSTGRSALYFVSDHDIGVMATVRKFTDKQWLSEFEKQLDSETKHFNALFEVGGLRRTDTSCKLVALEVL